MNIEEILEIARILTEDPDIFLEEDEDDILRLTYHNVFGETSQLTVLRDFVFPLFKRGHQGLASDDPTNIHLFLVVWPETKQVGTLVSRRLSKESRSALVRVAKSLEELRKFQSAQYRRNLVNRKYHKWSYMWEQYGRCCPVWFDSRHHEGPGLKGCYFSDHPHGEKLRSDVERGVQTLQHVDRDVDDPSDYTTSQLRRRGHQPSHAKLVGRFDSDYGSITVRKSEEGYVVSMVGEPSKRLGSSDEVKAYLEDFGVDFRED